MRHPNIKHVAASIFLSISSLLPAAVSAEPDTRSSHIRIGSQGGIDHKALSHEFRPIWKRDLGRWKLTASPSIELGHWSNDAGMAPAGSAYHGGGLLMARLDRPSGALRPYAEAGLGIALFDQTRIGTRNIASAFQFTEQLGFGIVLKERFSIGWRYVHYSNAGIKRPNDGLDMHTLTLGLRY